MPQTNTYPSYVDCVARALSQAVTPLSMEQLVEAVSVQRPPTKSARTAIYQAISKLYQAVPLGDSTYGWLDRLLHGNSFRHTLTKTELRRGVVYLDELLHGVFVPQFFQDQRGFTRRVTLDLVQGDEAMLVPVGVDRSTWALQIGPGLGRWVDFVGGQAKDDLVIRVDDATAGHYTLRLQPRESRDADLLVRRNYEVALAAEALLAQDRKMRSAIPVWELVALLIGQGLFRNPVPPEELHHLLTRYSGLRYVEGQGYAIRSVEGAYRESRQSASFGEDPASVLFGSDLFGSDLFGSDIGELNAIIQHMEENMSTSGFNPEWTDDEGSLDDFDPALSGVEFPDFEDDDAPCPAYSAYLDAFEEAFEEVDPAETPLSHDDYHLLEAEFEFLIHLQLEFDYLMPDQKARLDQLGERLYLDPEAFLDEFYDDFDGDYGAGDWGGFDEPPFWDN